MNLRHLAVFLFFFFTSTHLTSTHLFGAASRALVQAVRSNNAEAVASALQQGANVLTRTRNDRTPLHNAASLGAEAIIKLLLESITNTAQRIQYLECKDLDWKTALHVASEMGHLAAVNVLIDHGSNPRAEDEDDNTPLHLAARSGHHHVVWYLIALCEVDPNVRNQSGNTPLHLATANGDERTVRYLINGANTSTEAINRSGWKPIHYAAAYNRCNIMRMFIGKIKKQRQAISLGDTPFTYVGNPLHMAIHGEHKEMTALLLTETDEYTDERNRRGDTPLHLAARQPDPTLAQLLVQSGALCSSKDPFGRTPSDVFFAFPLASAQVFHELTSTQHVLPVSGIRFWLALVGKIDSETTEILDTSFPEWRQYLRDRERAVLEFVSVRDLRNLIILFAGPHYPSESERPEKRPRRA